jgi:hypothetical protein
MADTVTPVVEEADTPDASFGSDETGKAAAKRRRGRGVIYMGLREADEALRKIDQHEKSMSVEGFARALGHDAPKGRFLQKLEALRDFKLVDVTNDSVSLTLLATDMLYISYPQVSCLFLHILCRVQLSERCVAGRQEGGHHGGALLG